MASKAVVKVITCPHCKNDNHKTIIVLFPLNPSLYRPKSNVSEKVYQTVSPFLKELPDELPNKSSIIPVFFRCEKCKTAFKLDKNGREFRPRISRIRCPNCGFDEVGSMIESSHDHDPCLPSRSKGYRKVCFYDDILSFFVNRFQCPKCKIHFFVDEDGDEYIIRR